MSFFVGTQNDTIRRHQPEAGGAFVWGGASTVAYRQISPRPGVTGQEAIPDVPRAFIATPPTPNLGTPGVTALWSKGTQDQIVATAHPKPITAPGPFPSAAPLSLPFPPTPVLATRQDPMWALTGAGFFFYPSTVPLVFIGPQGASPPPQLPVEPQRPLLETSVPFAKPPLPLGITARVVQENPVDIPRIFLQWAPITSIKPVSPGTGQVVVKQEEPSLQRPPIEAVLWTAPQTQLPAPGHGVFQFNQNIPTEMPLSVYAPGPFVGGLIYTPLAQAISEIINAGLIVGTIGTEYSPTVPYGMVISQSVAGGTGVACSTTINLIWSLGQQFVVQNVVVPNMVGMTQYAAGQAICSVGLVGAPASYIYSSTVPQGYVISQSPLGGTSVPPSTQVVLVVSLGAQPSPCIDTVPQVSPHY